MVVVEIGNFHSCLELRISQNGSLMAHRLRVVRARSTVHSCGADQAALTA
jgi:hypothetical protein